MDCPSWTWRAPEVEDEQGQWWGREGWRDISGWKSLSALQVNRALLPCPLLSRTSSWSEQGLTPLLMYRPITHAHKYSVLARGSQSCLTILWSLLKQGLLSLLSGRFRRSGLDQLWNSSCLDWLLEIAWRGHLITLAAAPNVRAAGLSLDVV